MKLIIFGLILLQYYVSSELIVTKAERSIDLGSQLVKVSTQLSVFNGGSSVNEVSVAVEEEQYKYLAFIEAVSKKDEETKLEVSSSKVKDAYLFTFKLGSSLAKDASVTLLVEMVFSHSLEPFPAKITQSEKQQVVYKGNTYVFSPYLVKEQKTTVKLASSTIESYSRLKPSSSSDNVITYGPYKEAKAFKKHEMKIHFENNSPFVIVNEMKRWIEVSHWGNIAVEETYHMTHEGAKLKNHFSRYDYQRQPTHAAVKSFKTVLPASASDVYYRDEIGNISTSNLLNQDDSVEVELRPRFPLFGGWQTRYYLGYNLPAYQYLFNKGENFALKMRVVDHVFDDFVVDDLVLKIVLPEGALNIKFVAPYEVVEGEQENHKTYLDTSGRPVVVIKKKNLVENHIQDFELRYNFSKTQLLHEPLLCVVAYYILFVSVIILVRLDFSITKDAAKESRMKVASLIDDLLGACDRRSAIYASFDTALDKFKQGRDTGAFANATKKLRQDYTNLTQTITDICAGLVKEDAEAGEKLNDLKKKETERKVILDQLITLAEKVVAGKMGRPQYLENESNAMGKRGKLSEDIDALLGTL